MHTCSGLWSLVLLALCCPAVWAGPQTDVPPAEPPAQLEGLDAAVNRALEDNHLPGAAVAVVAGGRVVYARGFGSRDLEAHKPVTSDTLFAVGSTTKAMTATVIGMLVDEGRLEWDRPVRDLLPAFRLSDPVASAQITLRDLLTHRSGLPGHDLVWFNNNDATRAELIARLAHLAPSCGLRERWQYNNLMYMAAGCLAGQVSGVTWEEVMRKRLFEPLGMIRSNFSVTDSQRDEDFACPYRQSARGPERIPFRGIDVIGPAGSVNSSVNEMARWLLFNLSGGKAGDRRLIAAKTLAEIQSPQMVTGKRRRRGVVQSVYGMGWNVEVYRGHARVEHGGGIDGFAASVMLFPDDGLGIVSFDNGEFGNLDVPGLINNWIADRMLGLEPIDWLARDAKGTDPQPPHEPKERDARQDEGTPVAPGPSHPLDAYAGEYRNSGYGALEISLAETGLDAGYNGMTVPLGHLHYDVWSAAPAGDSVASLFQDMKFVFRTDAQGRISSVEAAFESALAPIIFEREAAR